jgi:predicted DNA-binding protein
MKLPETETAQREATSIKIKPDLWKEAKIEAIKHERTVSELVEEAIEAWIKEHRKK